MSLAVAASDRFVVFRLAQETYAVPVRSVREVVDAPAVTPVPRAPACVEGIINLRGNVVPVVNLARRLGLEGVAGARCIVVVEWDDEEVGLLVDEVAAVQPLDELQTDGIAGAGGTADPFAAALSRLPDGRVIVVLDLARLLDLRER